MLFQCVGYIFNQLLGKYKYKIGLDIPDNKELRFRSGQPEYLVLELLCITMINTHTFIYAYIHKPAFSRMCCCQLTPAWQDDYSLRAALI